MSGRTAKKGLWHRNLLGRHSRRPLRYFLTRRCLEACGSFGLYGDARFKTRASGSHSVSGRTAKKGLWHRNLLGRHSRRPLRYFRNGESNPGLQGENLLS